MKVHKDTLLNLFNPQFDSTLDDFIIYLDESIQAPKAIHLLCDDEISIKNIDKNIYRLPTLTEYKAFLSIWDLAISKNTKILKFKNISQVLISINYVDSSDNRKLILKTLQVYHRLLIDYHNKAFLIFDPKLKCYLDENEILRLNPIETFTLQKDNKEIIIEFQKAFWELNRKGTNLTLREIKVAILKKINSPLTVKLYLYFIKWTKNNGEYNRNSDFELNEFRNLLGLDSIQNSNNIKMFKFKLKKALEEIKIINPLFNFELDEEKFNNRENRLICFKQIKTESKIKRKPLLLLKSENKC